MTFFGVRGSSRQDTVGNDDIRTALEFQELATTARYKKNVEKGSDDDNGKIIMISPTSNSVYHFVI